MVFALGPVLSIVPRSQLASTGSQQEYLLFGLPYFAATLLFIAAYAGARAAPRTVSSVLFNSPIYLLALARVVSGYRPRSSGTTEKAFQPKVSLLVLPQIMLAAVLVFSIVFYAFDTRADRPVFALAWAGILLVALAGPLSSVSERRAAVERWQTPISGTIILAITILSAWTFAH